MTDGLAERMVDRAARAGEVMSATSASELTEEHEDSLALVDRARVALTRAHTLADIGGIMEVAERARRYAKAAKLGLDAENHAAALRLEAERRAGEVLVSGPKQGPGQYQQRGEIHTVDIPPSRTELGVTKQQAKVPDLVLVRRPRVVFLELKAERGQTTPAQRAWLGELRLCGQEVYLVRPSDWERLEDLLR